MNKLEEKILRSYFDIEIVQEQRIKLERLLHPEEFKWSKGLPPMSPTTKIKVEEMAKLGFGETFYQDMLEEEKTAKIELEDLAELHPLWEFIEPCRGFGKYLAGAFIAAGGDVARAPKASSFWKGMGLDIDGDGKAPRRTRGRKDVARKIPALPHVTKIGEQIRQSMLRQNSFFQDLYHQHKTDYRARYPDKPLMFAHKHGLRIAQKILYACLWAKWREASGLPAPFPYVFDILKHESGRMITIKDFQAK